MNTREIEAMAINAAAKANANEGFSQAVETFVTATEETKRSAVTVLYYLGEVFGQETLEGWPIPGSKNEEGKPARFQNPDIYTVSIAKPDGGTKTETRSFYTILADRLSLAAKAIANIEKLQKATKERGSVPEYTGHSAEVLKSMLAAETQRRNATRTIVKRAMALFHKFAEINGVHPELSASYVTDENDNPVLSPKCIYVQRMVDNKVKAFDTISVGQFLAMSAAGTEVVMAKENCDCFTALFKSAAAMRTPEQPTAKKVETFEMFSEYVADIANYVETKRADLLKTLAKGGDEADLVIRTIGDLYAKLDDLATKTEKRYNILLAADNAKEEAA